jgi:hypothetical protein
MVDPETKEPIFKIGATQELDDRLSSLYKTGVPFSFQCIFACEVENYNLVEKDLHFALKDYRVNSKREFFNIDPEIIIPLFKHFVGFKEITLKVEEDILKNDDSEEVTEVPDDYDTYDNLKQYIILPENFYPGLFCFRVSKLHGIQQKRTYIINKKQYYYKDVFLEEAKKEGLLKNE